MAYIVTPNTKGIKLFAEVIDRYYAEVDKWHFIYEDCFTTKEAFKKSLEKGGYLVKNIYTEQEYNGKRVAE